MPDSDSLLHHPGPSDSISALHDLCVSRGLVARRPAESLFSGALEVDVADGHKTRVIRYAPDATKLIELALSVDWFGFRFVPDFEAIWNPNSQVVEARVEPSSARSAAPAFYILDAILSPALDKQPRTVTDNRVSHIELDSPWPDVTLSIGYASSEATVMLQGLRPRHQAVRSRGQLARPLTLRAKGINTTRSSHAEHVLRRLFASTLFALDTTTGYPLKLSPYRDSSYRATQHLANNKSRPEWGLALHYDFDSLALYSYARGAGEMPLLQFLAFYQCLEYYFPSFGASEVKERAKTLLKQPSFDPDDDSALNGLVSMIQEFAPSGNAGERDLLGVAVRRLATPSEIRAFVQASADRFEYFTKKDRYKKLCDKPIHLGTTDTSTCDDVANRLYDVRCRIVHSKASGNSSNPLLPHMREVSDLYHEIELTQFLAHRAISASGRKLTRDSFKD